VTFEPACWSWPVPVVTREDEIERLIAENALVSDSSERRSPAAIRLATADWGGYLIRRFQGGRCAVCGERPLCILVKDHDHRTGLVRGWLCRSCNRQEPYPQYAGLFDLYRERPPAVILGVRSYYEGSGWPYGWWNDEALAIGLTGDPGWVRVEQTP
jgi:hypothetical protein